MTCSKCGYWMSPLKSIPAKFWCRRCGHEILAETKLGSSKAVMHRTVNPAIGGSIPPSPAKEQ